MRRLVFGLLLLASPALAQDVWLNYDFAHRPVPKWQNGYLLAYQTHSEPSALFVFDRTGQMVLNKRIEIPGSGEILIRDTAVSLDGRYAIAASGTATGTFIASLTPSGAMAWMASSKEFPVDRIVFAPDGSLWAFGDPSLRRYEDRPDYPSLRQYDAEGHLVRSVLPRKSFASPWPEPDFHAFMATTRDRIGIYVGGAREWIEVSFTGEVLGRWKGVDIPDEYGFATGAALLPNGDVYVSAQYHTSPRTEVLHIFKLNKQSGMWKIIDHEPHTPEILGIDGDQIVTWGPSRALRWARLE